MIDRRMVTTTTAACPLATPTVAGARRVQVRARVFRLPECGCCGAWVAHLEQHGFAVDGVMTQDMEAVKNRHAVPTPLRSCHTALIEGCVIEGHVPATDIRRLIDERLQARGLAVPGMPVGSPGIELGGARDPFDVILWSGSDTRIFSSHRG
ncbi:DUF411 domain-containing protein [Paracoccus nototheniae]|uniref:DUF411 domain-containing protein n=1 Tax=Paracoccus nototheniae TaxID=2489002 RepID=A0ABW4E2A2_9RHOB|nr:DUF411 domain-containing protein [Paracoccus nototheniae]